KHEEIQEYKLEVKPDIIEKIPVDTDFFKFIDELATRTGNGGFTSYIKDYLKKEGISEEEINKIWKDTHSHGKNG
ncbi:MAG: hypothetical protein L0956_08830, partial [Candidatus Mariimomonas ferrooxydans]